MSARLERLELGIDLELREVTDHLLGYTYEQDGLYLLSAEVIHAFLRAAWGHGYCMALEEDEPGSFAAECGYTNRPRGDG